ncbi:MAG: aminotransferase class I/II-fold pyridoxal phosphate-dependent enzyme, partial [Pelovirga sp.]
DHYHLDRLALAAASAALHDQDYLRTTVARICRNRDEVRDKLISCGYQVIPSQANYLFVSPPDDNGKRIYDALYTEKILVRYFSDPRLTHGVRISIGNEEEMATTLKVLANLV